MPASKSTIELTTVAIFLPLKYSPLNKAIDSEKGIQNSKARIDVISVPVMNDKAPNWLLTESHSEEDMNPMNPKDEKASMLLLIKP